MKIHPLGAKFPADGLSFGCLDDMRIKLFI